MPTLSSYLFVYLQRLLTLRLVIKNRGAIFGSRH